MTPAGTQPAAPPDINAETYPFDVVLANLDRAAYFHFHSTGEPGETEEIRGERMQTTGVRIHQPMRRFDTPLAAPPSYPGVKASNLVGETLASFDDRWLFMPRNYHARPGEPAPEEAFDPSCSQRFVMQGGLCRFRGGVDGFHGFGSGMTYPSLEGGRQALQAGAVGTLTSGFGRFQGLIGSYTCIGNLSCERGFTGSVLLRVMDPEGRLSADFALPPLRPRPMPESHVTYLVFRGQKRNRDQKTGFLFGLAGDIIGLRVNQQLRLIHIDAACGQRGRPRAAVDFGPVIGEMSANIRFNLTNPGAPGTDDAPIPFQSANTFTFYDGRGGVLGSIEADGGEGRTFRLSLPGAPRQAALRFGAFQPLLRGAGWFQGVEGMMTDNSAVGISPHAIATFYVLRIYDPRGKYRSALRDAWC